MVSMSIARSMPVLACFYLSGTVTPAHGRVEASSNDNQSGILTSDISILMG